MKFKEDGKFYAVKKSRERFKGKSDRSLKVQEVFKHQKLPHHPNLVEFVNAWEEEKRLYIQIELCECSLSKFAEMNHDIPESVVWNFLIDMLQAVHHLHSNDLLHLDIKPENIFISKDGLYKLGDFGLVVDANKINSMEPLEGDPKYLAKETMEGHFTKAADIFSLGITTLEMACDLDLPSGGDNWHLLRDNFDKIPECYFKNISPELKHVIKMMMHSNFELRPSASELLNYSMISKLRKKRNIRNRIRTAYYKSIDAIVTFFFFLMNILFVFKLIDSIKCCFSSGNNVSSTPVFKKDSSFSLLQMQSPYTNLFSVKKNRTSADNNNVYENNNQMFSLDSSMNLSKRNLRSTAVANKLQDSTVNSSANPNCSLTSNLINSTSLTSVLPIPKSPNSDITPPMYSFNHYIRDNADLQSTTHRSLKNRKTVPAAALNNQSFLHSQNMDLSNGYETPVKKGIFNKQNDSPTSIYFTNSFNQSNRLDFSDISDDDNDLIDPSKLNLSLNPNQTAGQKNLLKVILIISMIF